MGITARHNLTEGNITAAMLIFALPLIFGDLLQQFYNIADSVIIGRFVSAEALAAVGSAYTLMVFITSVILGLCMGASVLFSIYYGSGDDSRLKNSITVSFIIISAVSSLLCAGSLVFIDHIMAFMNIPPEIYSMLKDYLRIIFYGIPFTFIYNFFSSLLRAIGNSFVPLCFLSVSVVLNIGLDLLFILGFGWGVGGAASATVISQAFSAIGLFAYAGIKYPELSLDFRALRWDRGQLRDILTFSSLTCLQQSVMNFGILLVQGVVNKFGVVVMAAFAAAVKIDSFAYMPVQDFGNAFSTFVAQNYGAGKKDRIIKGARGAVACVMAFSLIVSVLVMAFSRHLMLMFVDASEEEVIEEGIRYLWIEGPFYFMIGILFLLYGYYRAVGKPGMSTVLTVFSLGTRVGLSYALSPVAGVQGIWWSIPIGWFLADAAGIAYYYFCRKKI